MFISISQTKSNEYLDRFGVRFDYSINKSINQTAWVTRKLCKKSERSMHEYTYSALSVRCTAVDAYPVVWLWMIEKWSNWRRPARNRSNSDTI